jgi:predicted nucleic acid-binding protein
VTLKAFIDTDVFLDTILQRQPHNGDSDLLLALCEKTRVHGHSSSLIMANLYFILRKLSGHTKAVQAVQKIRSYVKVLPLTDKEIGESIQAGFRDFEDGLQYFVCVNHGIDRFVTRNAKDFKKASIPVLSPREFLETLES